MDLPALLRELAGTPAPSFAEGERAGTLTRLWRERGLEPVQDEAGNVRLVLPGPAGRPRLALAAHLDTVFPAGTDLSISEQNGTLRAPGIGDNAASLTVLTGFLEELGGDPPCTIEVAATTGEEGLGDLRGAKAFLRERAAALDAFVAVDGYLPVIVDRAVGVRRYEVTFRAAGGHSWGNAGAPSAIHAIGEAIHELYRLPLTNEPRTTLNVGEIRGGTSVNSIASEAGLLLDLRSVDSGTLEALDTAALAVLRRVERRTRARLALKSVGDRPAGATPNASLVGAATSVLAAHGLSARTTASSTDANAAVPYGLPAIAFGVYEGGFAHRLDEWVNPRSLPLG
ncbi:MAG TPA: M20/M25/M40 family metallo-hydrolase, partial [Deinococcales bacterium]|nr:M20/M25/M40 family metallo-hydrolase [Deinococcales bacterium]